MSHNSSCYASLSHYNKAGAPVPAVAQAVAGAYVVPSFGAPGYDALTHGQKSPTCTGHFDITTAYGKDANKCSTHYTRRTCDGPHQ